MLYTNEFVTYNLRGNYLIAEQIYEDCQVCDLCLEPHEVLMKYRKVFIVRTIKDIENALCFYMTGKCNGKVSIAPKTYYNQQKHCGEQHDKYVISVKTNIGSFDVLPCDDELPF